MDFKTYICFIFFASIVQDGFAVEKWSKQVEEVETSSEVYDWTPVAQTIDPKERSGRVITYQQNFPPNAAFEDFQVQHVPPQNHNPSFGFPPLQFQQYSQPRPQGFNHHIGQGQSQLRHHPIQQQKHNEQSQQPTPQSFFKFEMPLNREAHSNQDQGIQTGYQIQHSSYPQLFHSPLFTQKQVFPPEFHPPPRPQQGLLQQEPKRVQQNLIEDNLKAAVSIPSVNPIQSSILSTSTPLIPFTTQQNYDLQRPTSFRPPITFGGPSPPPALADPPEDQEVQLLYVPYDALYNQQKNEQTAFENNKYNIAPSVQQVNPYHINSFYRPENNNAQDFNPYTSTTSLRTPTNHYETSTPYQNPFRVPTSTGKPKPRAHQPPLAMFLLQTTYRPKHVDVVNALKNAKTIPVLDAPISHAPNVFVGPAGMNTPNGYVKFDLPYLSQIPQNTNLAEISFFVAPLSYRSPAGFSKILLPEPHVGSIVINKQKLLEQQVDINKSNKYSHVTSHLDQNNNLNQINNIQQVEHPERNRGNINRPPSDESSFFNPPHQKRIRPTTSRPITREKSRLSEQAVRTQPNGQSSPDVSTQKTYYSEAIQEVTSPKIHKAERTKEIYHQKKPESHYTENVNPYAQFRPMPNNIPIENFYKVQPIKPATTTKFTTTSTTVAPTNPPMPTQPFFSQTYPTTPQIEFPSTSGQLHHSSSINGAANRPLINNQHLSDEEDRMKQYFRQQNAFRNRPAAPIATTISAIENIPYTSGSTSVNPETQTSPTTPGFLTNSSPNPRTPHHKVTFYHPTTTPHTNEDEVFEFTRNYRPTTKPSTPKTSITATEFVIDSNIQNPSQKRPNESNTHEPMHNDNTDAEFDPNPFQLPSELPPLTPNLPGLVNGLIEKNKISETQTTVQVESVTQPTVPTRPSRRPINRLKKPVVSKVSQSVSYSSTDYSTRRPTQRTRRPYTSRNYTTTATPSTSRSTVSRSPINRNPNRIRYNPTPEERETLRIKSRKHQNGGKKGDKSDDLEYQRDVLKQNYPVFKPPSRRPLTSPSAPLATERPLTEEQEVVTMTPNSDKHLDDVLESMKIAQQYNEYSPDNFGPGYFPNEEEINPTEALLKNEINEFPSSSSPKEIPSSTRRTPFIRRGPRIRTTTSSPPTTITPANDEQYTVRTRAPSRRVVKIRTRTRRPTTSSQSEPTTTESINDFEQDTRSNYNRLNRFNQDLYEDAVAQQRQDDSQFRLEPQESQWSPSFPKSSDGKISSSIGTHGKPINEEPEFITISPDAIERNSYEFNVTANLQQRPDPSITEKSNISFADILEEVMTNIERDSTIQTPEDFTEKPNISGNDQKKKAKWKPSNTALKENFETAESQNIGAQFFNSLFTGSFENVTQSLLNLQIDSSSTQAPTNDSSHIEPNTEGSLETSNESSHSNFKDADDLETKPSIFSEVRKQLNEILTSEQVDKMTRDKNANVLRSHKLEYTNIHRTRTTDEHASPTKDDSIEANEFHKNLMDSAVYDSSPKADVTETEICYKGQCIRSEDLPPNHKLH